MGLKSGTGKCLIAICNIAFSFGFYAAIFSPAWVQFDSRYVSDSSDIFTAQVRLGPVYGQTRVCPYGTIEEKDETDCSEWEYTAIDTSDCDGAASKQGEKHVEFCSKTNAWRVVAILCFMFVFVASVLVCAGACFQAFTCGCCGASLDCIAMMFFWIEVLLSIVSWSFVIASVRVVRNDSTMGVVESSYEWGFWLFVFVGTVFGIVCATLSDWAAENSLIRRILCCFG